MYQIKDWRVIYENNKSRERDTCSFVCLPNGQGGMGFNRIMAEPDGRNIYGIFCLMAGACSRQRVRDGYLTVDGLATSEPLTAEDMALMWRASIGEIQRALDVLSSPKVGWITELDGVCETSARRVPAECPPGALKERRKEGKKEGESEDTQQKKQFEDDLSKGPEKPVFVEPAAEWMTARCDTRLRNLQAMIGERRMSKQWPAFKRLIEKYNLADIEACSEKLAPDNRWPDRIEQLLFERAREAAIAADNKPEPRPLSPASLEAIRVYETQGPEVIRSVLQWHDVEECNIRYGLEDKENAEYLLANMPKAAV